MHWASGVCALLGGIMALVGVITFASAGIEKAACFWPDGAPKPDNFSCGYGGAFALAIVGALLALAQGAAFFALIKTGDAAALRLEGQDTKNPAAHNV